MKKLYMDKMISLKKIEFDKKYKMHGVGRFIMKNSNHDECKNNFMSYRMEQSVPKLP